MATIVNFNGQSYSIPAVDDDNWGVSLSQFLIAIPLGCLQNTGGAFTLTSDVNFGSNFGLVSKYFKSNSANIAASGQVRLANLDTINFRNFANNGNLPVGVNSSDQLMFNGSTIFTGGITALTADGTASGPGSAAFTLSTVNSNIGAFYLPTFTVNAKGLVTAASGNTPSQILDTISATRGAILERGASGWSAINPGTASFILTSNGPGADPSYQAAPVATTLTTKGDLQSYSNANSRFPVGLDGQEIIADSNQTLGVRYKTPTINNYILNSDFAVGLEGWASYADAAGNTPIDGTGGTATGLTFARSTSAPLNGVASATMTQANSTSIQGKGISYDFTIDSADQAQVLAITANYNASSTFIASDGITPPSNDGSTTTNAGNSDVEVFLYDKTNGILIPVTPQVVTANGANNFSFKGVFQTAPNSTSYRLIFHVAKNSANATGWVFKLDNIFVGRQSVSYGPPVTDWVSFTPTGSWNTNSTYTGRLRRVGDSLEMKVNIALAGAPNSAQLTVNLPAGLSIDLTKIVATDMRSFGSGTTVSAGADYYDLWLGYNNTTSLQPYVALASGTYVTSANSNTRVTQSLPNTYANGDYLEFSVRGIPIAGWSSSCLMSNDANTKVVAFSAYKSTTSSGLAGATDIIADIVTKDTNGTYNPATGVYTIGVSSWYTFAGSTRTGLGANGNIEINAVLTGSNAGTYALNTIIGVNTNTYNVGWMFGPQYYIAGDTIKFQLNAPNTHNMQGGATLTYWGGVISSGPASIAASESVNGAYTGAPPTGTINGSLNIVTFGTKVKDTANAYSAGTLTIPSSGSYSMTASTIILGTHALNGSDQIFIYKNGALLASNTQKAGGAVSYLQPVVSLTAYPFLTGDLVTIRTTTDCTGPSYGAGADNNYFNFARVGN